MKTHRADGPATIQPARIITSPAARRWAYGVGAAIIPLLIALGVINADHGALWLALIAAILAPAGLGLAAINTPTSQAATDSTVARSADVSSATYR